MSIKIEHDQDGNYAIKLWKSRTTFHAKTIKQLALAVEHYFGTKAHVTRNNNWKGLKNCPLCEAFEG